MHPSPLHSYGLNISLLYGNIFVNPKNVNAIFARKNICKIVKNPRIVSALINPDNRKTDAAKWSIAVFLQYVRDSSCYPLDLLKPY